MIENSEVVTSGCPAVTNLQLPKKKVCTGRGRPKTPIEEKTERPRSGNKGGRPRKVSNPEIHIANLGGVSTEDIAMKPSQKQLSLEEMVLRDIKRDWISAVTKAQSKGAYNNFRDEIFDSCKSMEELTDLYDIVFKDDFNWQISDVIDLSSGRKSLSFMMDCFYLQCQQQIISSIFENGNTDLREWLTSLSVARLRNIFAKLPVNYNGNKSPFSLVTDLILFYVEKEWEMELLNVSIYTQIATTFEELEAKRLEISKRIRVSPNRYPSSMKGYKIKFKHDAFKFLNIKYHDKYEKLKEMICKKLTGDEIVGMMQVFLDARKENDAEDFLERHSVVGSMQHLLDSRYEKHVQELLEKDGLVGSMKDFLDSKSNQHVQEFLKNFGFGVFTIPTEIMDLCNPELLNTMIAVVEKKGTYLFQAPDIDCTTEHVLFSETRKMADFAGMSKIDFFALTIKFIFYLVVFAFRE